MLDRRGSITSFLCHPIKTAGWTCGCWTGYPDRWWKRSRAVRWLARFDPVEYP